MEISMGCRMVLVFSTCVMVSLAAYTVSESAVAARQDKEDHVRYLDIDDNLIFQAMGTQAWKVHLPAATIRGKTRCVLKMQADNGEPVDILTEGLSPNRKQDAPLVVTVVVYMGTTEYQQVKRIHYTFASSEFFGRRSTVPPIEGFDGLCRSSEVSDPTAGLKLGGLSSKDGRRVEYSLWLE